MAPNTIRALILAETSLRVAERGWTFVYSQLGGHPVGYGYSVGFARTYGHPEAVVTGLNYEVTDAVLAGLATKLAAGEVPPLHERIDLGLTYPVVLRPIPERRAREVFFLANAFYGGRTSYRAVQVVWPDETGRYPWEAGHRLAGNYQPLLFDDDAPH